MNAKTFLLLASVALLPVQAQAQSPVSFDQKDTSLHIQIDGKPFATYVWQDPVSYTHLTLPTNREV